MKRGLTIFLRMIVLLMGIGVLAVSIFVFPKLASYMAEILPNLAYLQYPFLIGLYATSILFFLTMYQTLKLLRYIDNNQTSSASSVSALKKITHYESTIGILYVFLMPLIFLIGEIDDAPGLILMGLIIIVFSIAIAYLAYIYQKKLRSAT